MTKLCLGTVQFGMDYGVQGNGQPSEESVFEMLRYAYQHGIVCLDTASVYGGAEEILGRFFAADTEAAKRMSVVSKLPPEVFKDINKTHWASIAAKNATDSINRLHVDGLKAYLFHNAAYIFDQDAVEAILCVKKEGLAQRVGVSVYTPEEAMKALEYEGVDAVQVPYNVFDQRLDKCGFFKRAKEQGVEIFARSSLLQGLAVMEPDKLPKHMAFASEYVKKLHEICRKYDLPVLNAAVGYVGMHKDIDFVVFGVDNREQLAEYINIGEMKMSQNMIDELKLSFRNVEEKVLNPSMWKTI